MSQTVTYTLSLLDRISAPMSKIVGTSDVTIGKFSKLQSQSKSLQAVTKDLGGSLGTLRDKLGLLRNEKELINPKNFSDIKRYNREIQSLEKQIDKLDSAGRKKGFLGGIKDSLGGLLNPSMLAAAAGGFILKDSMNLDEQFAKVNITAQLEGASFEKLKSDIIGIAQKNKVDISMAPVAYEKILSQTNDVGLSLQILDSTLKGAKAGFASTDVVAGALAQTLSIVGKENANANEVLDTFFAAKRVGAGEFADFANYMPSLIAGANALGIKYKEVAGIYAYMTGKGQSAERASVLMNNMFSMLGRGDVVKQLKKAGIEVFDNGKIRSTVDIFRDMSGVMASMNDEQKSNFIEKLGVVDKEAKSSFMVMTSDIGKLDNSLKEVSSSAGEADKTLAFSANSLQRAQELWASLKGKLLDFGTSILPLVDTGLSLLGVGLDVVSSIVGGISVVFGSWYDMLADGNPVIWALTVALGVAGVMIGANKIKLLALSAVNLITTATTGGLTTALKFLKTTMLASPIGWLLLGVGALVGGITALCTRTDKVTKSFAAMNAELSKSKAEAKDSFAVAMQAAEGTDARKEAVRKLNEQYGEYLPNLLSETANNNELTTALNSVNGQLERKLLNKFRDQALEEAMARANEAKTEILNWMLDEVDPGKQKQLAADFDASWDRLMSGQSDWRKEQKFYEDKYDIDPNFFSDIWHGGINPSVEGITWNAVGGKMMDLQNAAANYYNEKQRVDLLYNSTAPREVVNNTTNNITNYAPYQAYNDIMPSYMQTGIAGVLDPKTAFPASAMPAWTPFDAAKTNSTANTTTSSSQKPAPLALDLNNNNNRSSSTNSFDLDQIATNEKGSTTYGAIVSKLNRVKIAGLAAASLASVVTTPLTAAATPINESVATNISTTSDTDDYDKANRPLVADKFCDQIVIHIANADGKGEDEIKRVVVKVLGDITNNYNQH